MAKFKVGDKVVGKKSANRLYDITREGYEGVVTGVSGQNITIGSFEVLSKYFKIIKKGKSMHATKKTKGKAEWKVGDIVKNDEDEQKSKVLAVSYDSESEVYRYTLQCLDDSGSIHLVREDDISEVETIKMTVAELKEYYEEQENCEVIIKK